MLNCPKRSSKMKIISLSREIDDSLATYSLEVDVCGAVLTGKLVTDMDGNYAQWDDSELGGLLDISINPDLWDEFVEVLDSHPQVAKDIEDYYG